VATDVSSPAQANGAGRFGGCGARGRLAPHHPRSSASRGLRGSPDGIGRARGSSEAARRQAASVWLAVDAAADARGTTDKASGGERGDQARRVPTRATEAPRRSVTFSAVVDLATTEKCLVTGDSLVRNHSEDRKSLGTCNILRRAGQLNLIRAPRPSTICSHPGRNEQSVYIEAVPLPLPAAGALSCDRGARRGQKRPAACLHRLDCARTRIASD